MLSPIPANPTLRSSETVDARLASLTSFNLDDFNYWRSDLFNSDRLGQIGGEGE
jgi:hypothetical protein